MEPEIISEYEDIANDNNETIPTFAAKKSLGQNFLHAPHVIGAMVHAARILRDDAVLEVGPGKGALTSGLLEAGARVIAVEKDDRAIPFLAEKFSSEIKTGKLKLVHGDILEIEPAILGLKKGEYSIVANIPYYISGEFLRKFLESDTQPTRIVVMLQKELAKRITDTKESILSISVKAYGNPKYITSVPRKFFRPMPNVDSAVLLIENISKKFFTDSTIDEKNFFDLVKTGFSHKRKVLMGNLKEKMAPEALKNLWQQEKWEVQARAEELSLEQWKKIVCFPQK
jgi:16S rRNA (adenine1518-N6/adenine1519-N6)-dimethyltransferase